MANTSKDGGETNSYISTLNDIENRLGAVKTRADKPDMRDRSDVLLGRVRTLRDQVSQPGVDLPTIQRNINDVQESTASLERDTGIARP